MKTALLSVLCLTVTGYAADLEVVGERNVKAGQFADLTVKGQTAVDWFVYPPPSQSVERGGGISFAGEPGKVYAVKATVIDFVKKVWLRSDIIQVTFAGGSPVVPPTPNPDVDPPPAPPVVGGLKVLITYGATLTDNQTQVIQGQAVRDALDKYAAEGYRIYPLGHEAEIPDAGWKELALKAKELGGDRGWLVIIKDGKAVYNDACPYTPDGVIRLLKKYGGG